jgi:hypothetical protein
MKTKYLLLIGLALALPVTRTLAGTPGIVGSAHDFTVGKSAAYSWNVSTTSHGTTSPTNYTCQVCHTPHGADTTSAVGRNVPLWGHYTSTATYTQFVDPSGELTAAEGSATVPTPSGVSLACLSCHDGTVAINQEAGTNNFLGGTAVATGSSGGLPTWADLGTNLQATHPISVNYPSFTFLNPTSTALGAAAVGTWPTATPTIASMLYNGKVECASCHDVHNQIGDAPNDSHLLKIGLAQTDSTGRGDLLCRTCHIK